MHQSLLESEVEKIKANLFKNKWKVLNVKLNVLDDHEKSFLGAIGENFETSFDFRLK